MTLRGFAALLAVGAAVVMLGLLLRTTLNADAGVDRHRARLQQLSTLSTLHEELEGDVAAVLSEPGTDPAILQQRYAKLIAARNTLNSAAPGFTGLSASIDASLKHYLDVSDAQLARMAAYRKWQTGFTAGYRQFDLATSAAIAADPAAPLAKYATDLLPLLREYCRAPTAENAAQLMRQLARIDSEARSLPASNKLRAPYVALSPAVIAVLTARDQGVALAAPLTAADSRVALQQLQERYENAYRGLAQRGERYRLVLVAYAVALLIAFGVIGLRLRLSFNELDQLNGALQKANEGLERDVEARTVDLRKALDDLRLQQAQLIQSEKMASLGQMVAGVAHEINTPLGYARSNVGVVRESLVMVDDLFKAYEGCVQAPPEAREPSLRLLAQCRASWDPREGIAEFAALLDDAEHGFEQISELVMSLKDFSRVDRSKTELFDVNEGLETALKLCHNQMKGRIGVERDLQIVEPVLCAPSQLNQVFINILNNAAQAIDGPGTITVRSRDLGDRVVVAIRDSGIGMDEETQRHIFEPFFTTKPVGQGTGLGLSIVFRIVEDHGGSIEIDSAPGAGTEFRVILPRRRPAPVEVAAEEEAIA
ncbi:MAG: sensor histidine kinase [Solimonas sp.]